LSDLLLPTDEATIAAVVREAAGAGEPLAIIGNDTKAGMLRPVQAARTLSTRNLTGITLYSPNELVISARAGTRLAEIEATLAEHRQHIIAEPPDLAAIYRSPEQQTLGGMIATNLSGPRRIAWGAMRDHVLGIRAVTGHGEAIHSGGRVLKNVTGLDLCKLLTGSHGTLGVITEVTLKVLPAPEAAGTLVLPGVDAAAGVAALSAHSARRSVHRLPPAGSGRRPRPTAPTRAAVRAMRFGISSSA
jgi:glycolate oxidase FAD binding subunit